VTRLVWQLFTVKWSKVKVTRSSDVSADKNDITRHWMVISTSKLGGNYRHGGHSAYKMKKKSTEIVAKSQLSISLLAVLSCSCTAFLISPTVTALTALSAPLRSLVVCCLWFCKEIGAGIEWRRQKFYCKFTNSRFCACAVKVLLKMAENAQVLKSNTINRRRWERLL